MREDAFGRLAVGLPAENPTAHWRTHGHGRREIACAPIAEPRGFRHELIEGGVDIVGELDLRHGPKSVSRHADSHADNAPFVYGRVEYTGLAIFRLQPLGRLEHAPEIADVLAHHDDIGIAAHHHVERAVDCLEHRHAGHSFSPAASRSAIIWSRCSLRCAGTCSNTSSNMVSKLWCRNPSPSTPLASALRAISRTFAIHSFSSAS